MGNTALVRSCRRETTATNLTMREKIAAGAVDHNYQVSSPTVLPPHHRPISYANPPTTTDFTIILGPAVSRVRQTHPSTDRLASAQRAWRATASVGPDERLVDAINNRETSVRGPVRQLRGSGNVRGVFQHLVAERDPLHTPFPEALRRVLRLIFSILRPILAGQNV